MCCSPSPSSSGRSSASGCATRSPPPSARGIWVGGPVPLGYRSVGKKLEVVAGGGGAGPKNLCGLSAPRLDRRSWPRALDGEGVRPKPRMLANGTDRGLALHGRTARPHAEEPLLHRRGRLSRRGPQRRALRETRLVPTFDAAALFSPSGTLARPSSRAAAFERTINWVSVSFAIVCSSSFVNSIRCHQRDPAKALGPAGFRRAAPQRLGNGHSNARRATEVQSVERKWLLGRCHHAPR